MLSDSDLGVPMRDTAKINLSVYDDFEKIGSIQEEWDEFIESIGGEIFLTYDWCRIWWKYYGGNRHLRIYIFRQNDKLVGILPLFVDPLGIGTLCLRIIKVVGTDFTPVTVSIPLNPDLLDTIIKLFMAELSLRDEWDILCLGPICGRYPFTDELYQCFGSILSDSYEISIKTNDVQTYFDIADSWENQIAKLSKQERKRMRRAYREIDERGISLESCLASDDQFADYFNGFIQMHQERWLKENRAGHFIDWPNADRFHHEIAAEQLRKNRLRLLRIKLRNETIGYKYFYKLGNTYYAFLDARAEFNEADEINFYRIGFGEQVKQALEEKVSCIDSMRGRYEHKLHLGGRLMPVKSIYIYSRGKVAKLRLRFFQMLVRLLNISYYKIWRRRITPKLKLKPVSLWNLWIRSHLIDF